MKSCTVSTDPRLLNMPWICGELKASYWGEGLTDERIAVALKNSLCFALCEDDSFHRQVGFARVVTDGAVFSSLMDVVIEPSLRGRGLGSKLIAAVVGHYEVERTLCLLSTRDATRFYEKFGFQVAGAMSGGGFLMRRFPSVG